jgi:hypothetical protein
MLFEAVASDDEENDKLFEDRIVLIRAWSEDDARQKGETYGESARTEYKNVYGGDVTWAFREILDVAYLPGDEIGDGSEVYYSLLGEEGMRSVRSALRLGP